VYTYTGRQLDTESGLYYCRYRFYAPHLGSFMSRDPIRYAAGVNQYAFVGGRPSSVTDPRGLLGESNGEGELTAEQAGEMCAESIAASLNQGGWKEIPGGEICDDCKKTCLEEKDKLLANDPGLRHLYSLYQNLRSAHKCKKLGFRCECCSSWENEEGYRYIEFGKYSRNFADPYIVLCWNALAKSPEMMRETIAHELTHALQHCMADGQRDLSCAGSLKREIEARICAGQCHGFDECLALALASSCDANGYCRAAAEVVALFDSIQQWFELKEAMGQEPGGFCSFY
jgi:RHS repeat-associated protein